MADCEWNPAEERPAFDTDPPHGEATWSLGAQPLNWHVCEQCAALPVFAVYRRRRALVQADAQGKDGGR